MGDANRLTKMMRGQTWTLESLKSLQPINLGQGVRGALEGRDWEGTGEEEGDRGGHLEAWDFVALVEEDGWLTAEGESQVRAGSESQLDAYWEGW